MTSIDDSYNYFSSLQNKYIRIPKMYYSGVDNRYFRFENSDPVIKKLRAVLYGDITGFNSIPLYVNTKKITTKWNPNHRKDWMS